MVPLIFARLFWTWFQTETEEALGGFEKQFLQSVYLKHDE